MFVLPVVEEMEIGQTIAKNAKLLFPKGQDSRHSILHHSTVQMYHMLFLCILL